MIMSIEMEQQKKLEKLKYRMQEVLWRKICNRENQALSEEQ